MKKITLLFIFISQIITSQEEFSFELYFEDAMGNKDTLILGYDPSATDAIDVSFGEINLLNQPWDSIFEVRASNVTLYGNSLIMESKKSIVANNQIQIELKMKHLPIQIHWDQSIFQNNIDVYNSRFYYPNLFDYSDILRTKNSIQVHAIGWNGDLGQYTIGNDTISFFELSFCDTSCHLLSIKESPDYNNIRVSPNPATNFTTIQLDKTINYENIAYKVLDFQGKVVLSNTASDPTFKVDLAKLNDGIYYIQLTANNRLLPTRKILITR